MKRHMQSSPLVPILVASMILAVAGWGASLQGLGDLPGGTTNSQAWAVSADGSTVVGSSVSSNGVEAFRWRNGVMTGLGSLPGGSFGSLAAGVSGDGSVVVGKSRSTITLEPYRWENGTMTPLGIPTGYTSAYAQDVSRDGLVVTVDAFRDLQIDENLNATAYSTQKAFQWSGGSFSSLGFWSTPLGVDTGTDGGVNTNGSVIVGRGRNSTSQFYEACRWDNGVITGLGFLSGGVRFSQVLGVAGDGRILVGRANSSACSIHANEYGEACRWDDGVITALGDLPGGAFESAAWAVSDDGEVVVGWGTTGAGRAACVWDRTNGIRNLKQVLQGLQLDLTAWTLTDALSISADGTVIVGAGVHNGNQEGWIARVSRNELLSGLEMNMTIRVSCVDVCWNSKTNKSYQVQYRSDLTTNQWANLGSTVSGNGTRICVTDAVTGEKRFYQVEELP